MVMQRSCSSFRVSVKRVSPARAEAMIPAFDTSESVRVDFPWSTCAITDMLRMLAFLSMISRIWSTVKFTWGDGKKKGVRGLRDKKPNQLNIYDQQGHEGTMIHKEKNIYKIVANSCDMFYSSTKSVSKLRLYFPYPQINFLIEFHQLMPGSDWRCLGGPAV